MCYTNINSKQRSMGTSFLRKWKLPHHTVSELSLKMKGKSLGLGTQATEAVDREGEYGWEERESIYHVSRDDYKLPCTCEHIEG